MDVLQCYVYCFSGRGSVFAVKFNLRAFVVALCLKKPQPQRLFQRWRRSERPVLSEECTLLRECVCINVSGSASNEVTSGAFSPDKGCGIVYNGQVICNLLGINCS